MLDSSVVLGGLLVPGGALDAGIVVEESEKKYIVVLIQPLTVSKPREAFLGNASQLEMIFLHSWAMVQSINRSFFAT